MRVIEKSIAVRATPAEVWDAWTKKEGIRSFFAPDADIALVVGGKYEIFFNHMMSYGDKGSEGCTVLDFTPKTMLSFTWNAPPSIPTLRKSGAFTKVVINLVPDNDKTKVMLSHFVEKTGDDWDRYYNYFSQAWDVVLGRLYTLFMTGPVDWDA